MVSFTDLITYFLLFTSLNFEVFMLIKYFERREDIKKEEAFSKIPVKNYPTVSIIVPCWNEENTVSKTVHSILNLDYPKDKLQVVVVDDGSTDGTWKVLQKFKNNPQVELHSKTNGGKYTALNHGLGVIDSDLVGCLDADSYVDKNALKYIVTYFQNKEIMAVTPSVKLWQPKTPLELLQKVEYGFGIFTRKIFHFMQAVYITPGPFSIFRREVFNKLGVYRHAHNTEDIEIALRMQKNGLKIAHAHAAIVHTVPPKTVKKLLKQRVRWSYGFLKNAFDYRDMFFNAKYGNLGVFVLPMAAISFGSIISVFFVSLSHFLSSLYDQYVRFEAVGLSINWSHIFNFDWFYVNTQIISLITIVAFLGTVMMILASREMSEGKVKINMDLVYYFVLYAILAPLWMAKAAFNAVFSIRTTWR